MKRIRLTLFLFFVINMIQAQNPFLAKYNTPHDTAPFDKIKTEHYEPAILEGMKQHTAEVEAITNNPQTPTFQNTIVALENSGKLLNRVMIVFSNLLGAETSDELQAVAQKMMPQLSEHENNINLNSKLFERVKNVYNQKEKLALNKEESVLLENYYKNFVRNGANLSKEAKEKYRALSSELSTLNLQYGQNLLKESNNYEMLLTDKEQLAGLPESAIEAAAYTAKEKGKEGWMFTLDAPSYMAFLKYNDNRDLREKLHMAYNSRCTHDNEYNTLNILTRIANIRMEQAQLLGYESYAAYVLEERMAKNSEAVYNLLNQLVDAYSPAAKKEYDELLAYARRNTGPDFQLMSWDWSYYAEKLKDEKFSINTEVLRPYFELSKVEQGVFGLATTLYGITFKENKNIPVYHKDVKAYEVFDKDGKYLAVLYTDFHPRAGKSSGAWMTEYKGQWKENGKDSRPHISMTMNFTKPTESKPALLSYYEVRTFLHEFGHSLHGMFANSTYESLSGTNVYRDFVELPSQIMENFLIEKDFLHTFAKHYQTGELIPDSMVQKIVDSSNFNVAYACLHQISFGLLDMAWYNRNTPFTGNVEEYEKQAYAKAQILPTVNGAYMSPQFSHIFDGGYSAGYYGYKWAEVMDADAFSLFKQKGIFSKEVGKSFRENVLSKGRTEHPMQLYKRFRGQEPTIDALLKRNGIN